MPAAEQVPERVGRYEVVLKIARGGMATVYLGRAEGHGGFDRYIAVTLTAEHLRADPEFAEHLVEEAKLVAHLRHPNVVPVLDVGTDDFGAVFLVMEYVPGDALGGLFKHARKTGTRVEPRVGVRILVDSLAGLHAAHEHSDEDGRPLHLVHRDFSPQNVLVGTDGIARLTDFGIAKAASRASTTMAGTMKGKISYASPEQARGEVLDRRCDVWSAGVVAWELFAGRKLYPSTDRTLLDIVEGPPPRLRDVVPDVPLEIDAAIMHALAFDVSDRTPTAQAFARELSAAARQHGMLAEVEEVAEHVQRVVAPVLAERKQMIAEARARRAQSSPEHGPNARIGLPSLPDLPLVTVRLDHAPPVPAEVTATMSDPRSTVNDEDVRASPERFGMDLDASPTRAGHRVREHLAKLRAASPAVVIGGGAAIAMVVLLVGVLAFMGGRSKSSVTTAPSGSAAPAAGTAPRPMSLGPAEPLPPEVVLAANAPIARVRFGKRVVDAEVPAPRLSIDLTPDETGTAIDLTATSVDGRTADASWHPGDSEVSVAFGDAPTTPAAPPPHPKPRKKHR